MRDLELRLQRLERIAAMSVISPERAAQARQKLADLLDTIGPGEALRRLEARATSPHGLALRDTLRRVLEVNHADS